MLLNPLQLHNPTSLAQAAKLYAELDQVKIIAGGTFLMNSLKLLKRKGSKTPQHVISLSRIPELKGIELKGGQLTIKAMTIINDLYDSDQLKDNLAVLRAVCKNISTHPIRNMATVGGNLTCRYTWTEMGAVMIGLDAAMHFMDSDGKDHAIPAEEFFKNAAKSDKIFSHVTIPHNTKTHAAYRRVRKTLHVDVPLLAVYFQTEFENGCFSKTRVAVNNTTTFAQRDSTLEEFLNGKKADPAIAQEALDHLNTDIYDKRSDEYKQHMFRVSIRDALNELVSSTKK